MYFRLSGRPSPDQIIPHDFIAHIACLFVCFVLYDHNMLGDSKPAKEAAWVEVGGGLG